MESRGSTIARSSGTTCRRRYRWRFFLRANSVFLFFMYPLRLLWYARITFVSNLVLKLAHKWSTPLCISNTKRSSHFGTESGTSLCRCIFCLDLHGFLTSLVLELFRRVLYFYLRRQKHAHSISNNVGSALSVRLAQQSAMSANLVGHFSPRRAGRTCDRRGL